MMVTAYILIELFAFIFIFWMGTIAIACDGYIYNEEDILGKDFLKFTFQYQLFVLDVCKNENINMSGIIILEIITTAIVIWFNLLLFAIQILALILMLIVKCFCFCFRKKG